ncbi:stage III sporulation protein AD [uncultured Roseburia sp.]|uniref:Stage III sporulation protein AD n=1 Tax=Brotonthovivens ammoniilytica TaxID=2981725 RepID=A0ABT2TFQ7_9FIRM|nr:SpoIIIAC/SpoIIIAD family protein [Brotonthovivens ammoniilytica]MCU6760971.1 stage III sporulation protein AD [Brotonthovivens ammoniilytica]SCI14999.1 stage III sporulation protein AD [uncultured Roseburia sp.]
MSVIKVAMIGVCGVLLAVFLKQQKNEYALYISMGAAVLILLLAVNRLGIVMESIEKIQSVIKIDSSYVKVLVKMIGITYVAEFASGLCKDAGYASVGAQIEMFGKFSIMAVSMPVLLALIETVEGFLT